jgi:long-subunit fatty acid transport protein
MKWQRFTAVFLSLAFTMMAGSVRAAHPLITDDTGTQGKGKFQLEMTAQYDWDKENIEGVSVKTEGVEASAALSYGIADNVDLVLALPYLWGKAKEDNMTVYDENGFGDAVLEVKMRFFEKNGFSLALKPGMSFPTGNDNKGLGTDKLGGHLFLITSQEIGTWELHANFGYIRNENDADERKDLWHASVAATWEIAENLKLAANMGIERNPDDQAKYDPAFLIGGIIYSINENIDIDLGVKYGLNKPETDMTALAGLAFRF